jgi:branched-chain amino acid transport system ATP-binding protein
MLKLENLMKSFGGVTATRNVSIEFPTDSLTAIIGPNGAGKTTLFNLITGRFRLDSGRILLDGEDIAGLPPRAIVRRGVGRAFQVASLFPTLTVEEALCAAVQAHTRQEGRKLALFPLRDARERALEVMEILRLTRSADVVSANLSHGDQKLLDIGLALALEPKVLLLDEPTAGMGPEERWQMMDTVQRLWRRGGITLIFIEHDMDIVFKVAQKIHVLSYGALLAEGTAEEIRNNPKVIEAYLGKSAEKGGAAA